MKRETKKNRLMIAAFTVLYAAYAVCLFWYHPFVASAKEPVPGGKGNTVVIKNRDASDGINDQNYDITMQAKDNYEIVAVLSPVYPGSVAGKWYQRVSIYAANSSYYSLNKDNLADYVGVLMNYYLSNGKLQGTNAYTMDNIKSSFNYTNSEGTIYTEISGCKVFDSMDSFRAYLATGSLDGMINDDVDVDSGIYDKGIGYLHDLKHQALMYGEEDENGLTSSFDERFTWSDYYPEYDDSYMVEVRASCEVEVKKWFGIGKSIFYNSDIRELAHDVKYKDLQYVIGLADEKSVFSDFLNEYMPGNSSVSDVISAATYQFDAYYFRIYRWDDEEQTYKYGLWVRLTKNGTALTGSLETTVDAGTIDKDGKWKQDPSSDYGEGKEDTTITGKGDTQEDAKNEADQKQEDKDSGIKDIDLSNTNFKELWEWFTGCLVSFWEGLGVIPDFFGRIFSFLPAPVIGFVALAIVAAIILRVIGR